MSLRKPAGLVKVKRKSNEFKSWAKLSGWTKHNPLMEMGQGVPVGDEVVYDIIEHHDYVFEILHHQLHKLRIIKMKNGVWYQHNE